MELSEGSPIEHEKNSLTGKESNVDNMNLGHFMKAVEIFVEKKWTEQHLYATVLRNYVQLLLNLSDDQRNLILELTSRYKWMSMNEIGASLTQVLDSIELEKLEFCKRVYIFPIMKPEDQEKIKSGHSTIYTIRGIKPLLSKYEKIEFIELQKYEEIKEEEFNPANSDLIFLVDDYLGSGETIDVTLDIFMQNKLIDISQICIITVAAQEETVEHINKRGMPVYYNVLAKKGITGFFQPDIAKQKVEIMLEIEKMISMSNAFSLGYNKSEALITLTRTPDNTFPIFWKGYKKSGKKYNAPFPRY